MKSTRIPITEKTMEAITGSERGCAYCREAEIIVENGNYFILDSSIADDEHFAQIALYTGDLTFLKALDI